MLKFRATINLSLALAAIWKPSAHLKAAESVAIVINTDYLLAVLMYLNCRQSIIQISVKPVTWGIP